ncbi:MAG: UDP-N-acetylglucosamine--N-acetylmuramyl-(pentapeptide) pyrophosphoryl-undecaprenol N-acetylglucosamine transferase [Verrucomicrobiota bacterium]|nr:UDP-N-acetylglucosamine--N-acetylmuramyl-(pentapeptide) pyrophosphoryl-undecaprenol N-acetylglucosamine transferase [Opitutae bacterium]MEC7394310.1 UDP-N-acetylglucosamine--N-acetylmuramyl-(pentapeptide) pyrophosphoryl-undecaprenol N-acetylglucosamine transferase [Verrucomicrobiota bacterium]MEC7542675.1 UDP-N-acetylglucosamine--N-acetylmuramyl-(pentapeptide) pyrophosphoryl-undecaprenol N-acetylglucosamine transferase [Verrucomicrobiota bacterium]MEC7627564.1 UDP-N-acetylglucosamine--N-acety|tara:strand:- start:2860 stop:3999 length:1140 start_codon:yes stop_codon:yes gene_type:complete
MRNIVIACGGTGGHLTPGIALAQSLEEKGYPCWLFISQKSVDTRLSSKYPKLSFEPMPGAPLIRTPLGVMKFGKGFLSSFLRSQSFYRKVGADALIGFGGFSTFGPAMAARSKGIPIFIHEANRAVGKAVRFLAKRSTRVYLPEGMRMKGISPEIVRNMGYPLRQEFRRLPRERARKQLGISLRDRLLVVLGGSQGASSLNKWVKGNLTALADEGISIYCLTGMNKESSGVVQLDGPNGQTVTSRFVSFTDEMNVVLSAADLVISRAGAGAIAEIVRCRVPSILVPYPHAADNHQFLNANFLEGKGGAIVCEEKDLTTSMMEEVREVMFNEEFRAILRRNLFSLDEGDAADRMVSDISQCLNEKPLVEGLQQGSLRVIS